MKEIPDDILLYIFDYLNFYDRRQAKQVSKQWHEILCRSRYSRNEVLSLEHCLLDDKFDPMLTIMSTRMQFTSVRIRGGVKWSSTSVKSKFFSFIGSYTTELIMDSTLEIDEFREILKYFPNLQIITTKMALENLSVELPENLKSLHVSSIIDFDVACQLPKSLKRLTCDVLVVTELGAFFQHDANIKPGFWRLKVKGDFNVLDGRVLTLKNVDWITRVETPNLLLNNSENSFTLGEEIELNTNENGCFFIHAALDLVHVKRISLEGHWMNPFCYECFCSLMKSCRNVVHWKLYRFNRIMNFLDFPEKLISIKTLLTFYSKIPLKFFTTTKYDSFGKSVQFFQHLESLKVEFIQDVEENEWMKWPAMPRLRSFVIYSNFTLILPMAHIVRLTPNVRECDFHVFNVKNEDLETILINWPYLTRMFFLVYDYKYDGERLLEVLQRCRNLRTFNIIGLSCVQDDLFKWKLFEQVPTLRLIINCKETPYADYCKHLKEKRASFFTKLMRKINFSN